MHDGGSHHSGATSHRSLQYMPASSLTWKGCLRGTLSACPALYHWIVWRTSSTLFLIAQRTATSGHSIWTSCSTVVLLQTLWFCVSQMHVVVSLGNALHVGSKSCLYEFTELNFLSVGSQSTLPLRTLNIYWLIDWYSVDQLRCGQLQAACQD